MPHEHRGAGVADLVEPRRDVARLRTIALELQLVDDEDASVRGARRHGRGERGAAHLLWHALPVLTAVRAEHDAAVPPQRRAGRARARAAGALLAPRLRAAAGDAVAVLRRARRLTRVRAAREERLEHGRHLLGGGGEDLRELDRAARGAVSANKRSVALGSGRERTHLGLLTLGARRRRGRTGRDTGTD